MALPITGGVMELLGVEAAMASLRRGEPVLVYDSDRRERETDIIIASQHITPAAIRQMRRDGGGLVCATVPPPAWRRLGIPFLADLFQEAGGRHPLLAELVPDDIPYDTRSAFAITINHRRTFTGVTDRDRALTISQLAKMIREALEYRGPDDDLRRAFGRLFRAPGHVTLLNAAEGLLSNRQGHTEMATALVGLAGLTPSATICEMMGDDGRSLPREAALQYARERGLAFVDGAEVRRLWEGLESLPAWTKGLRGRAGVCQNGQ
ncbi:MAG: 3,4-dihydroxy-2-butanone-4-phosphate synthase [Thermoplasmata archaeon]